MNVCMSQSSYISEQLFAVGIRQDDIQLGEYVANRTPNGEVDFSFESFHQFQDFDGTCMSGLNQSEEVIQETEPIERWKTLVSDGWHESLEHLGCVLRAIEADCSGIKFDPAVRIDAGQSDFAVPRLEQRAGDFFARTAGCGHGDWDHPQVVLGWLDAVGAEFALR